MTKTAAIEVVLHPRADELRRLEEALAELEVNRCDGTPLLLTLEEDSAVHAQENRFAIVPGHPRVEGEESVEHREGFHVVGEDP